MSKEKVKFQPMLLTGGNDFPIDTNSPEESGIDDEEFSPIGTNSAGANGGEFGF